MNSVEWLVKMDYRDLDFYQKARHLVMKIDFEIKTWPNNVQSQTISRQLFRSATSKGANIAEGVGRHTGSEYIHYLIIARGSANEVDHWLNTAIDCATGQPEKLEYLLDLNNEIRKMLTASILSLQSKQKRKGVWENLDDYLSDENNYSIDD